MNSKETVIGILLFLISCVAIVKLEQAFAHKMIFIVSVLVLYGFCNDSIVND